MTSQTLEHVFNLITSFLALPLVSLLVGFYRSRSKNRVKNVEKLSKALSPKKINYFLVETLFRNIYKSKYVSAEEIEIIMKQKSPSRIALVYSQLNMLQKITEIDCVSGKLHIRYSHELRTKKQRVLWGWGAVILAAVVYFPFIFLEKKLVGYYYELSYLNQDVNFLDVFLNVLISAGVLILCNYLLLFGCQILISMRRINKIRAILSARV